MSGGGGGGGGGVVEDEEKEWRWAPCCCRSTNEPTFAKGAKAYERRRAAADTAARSMTRTARGIFDRG